jgi:hypothetical protein
MKVNIHNQCSDFKLTDGRYSNSDADWNGHLCWKVDAGNMMSVELIPFLSTFGGVLTCMLKSRYVNPSNPSEPTHIQLFVAWKSEGYKKLRIFVQLIRCYTFFHWNEIKLKEYYQKYACQLNAYTGPLEDTWWMDDDTVLMTRLNLDFAQRDGVLNIIISEGVENDYARRPVWVDPRM